MGVRREGIFNPLEPSQQSGLDVRFCSRGKAPATLGVLPFLDPRAKGQELETGLYVNLQAKWYAVVSLCVAHDTAWGSAPHLGSGASQNQPRSPTNKYIKTPDSSLH
ncbi:leucine-rich repeat-containing protein 20 [Platysternon megacephalum]|uniref:Leucine-rich repeat-containing protein 20 n=1 Tax=Platysternon megacephalum TaxID=55544 RepID=A0A4D9F1U2_9SAUR|nr:leucine-rich repeat-containing protein 20 [Platysternon megacephalum]